MNKKLKYFNEILLSLENGQKTQAKQQFYQMTQESKRDFFEWLVTLPYVTGTKELLFFASAETELRSNPEPFNSEPWNGGRWVTV